ncbi:MAG: DMT family transporter [Synergistaceae bacterium]|nr:DMT family transporter [Synergistaceae bacterium]
MKRKLSYHFFAAVTIFGWSLSYVFTRLAMRHFSANSLGFLRYAIASAILAAAMPVFGIRMPAARDLWKFAVAGAAGFFAYMVTFNRGAATETSATSSVIIATAPVMTAFLSSVVHKEKLKITQLAAIAVEFTGILTLTLWNGILSVGPGVPWLLGAAAVLCVFNLLQRDIVRTYTGLQASVFSIFAGALMLAVFAPAAVREVTSATPEYLFYLALLAILPSALSYVLWSIAIERAPGTSQVSNYMFVTPFLASLMGFLVAGERPDLGTVIGGAIVLSGVFIFNRACGNKK